MSGLHYRAFRKTRPQGNLRDNRAGMLRADMQVVRPVATTDIDLICRHRLEMFKASGRTDELVAPMAAPFRAWLEPRLADGRYFGWIIEEERTPIAGVGMMVIDWPPHPSHMTQDCRGYMLNMYVEAGHRRRGLGKRLVGLVTEEAVRRGIGFLVLHATTQGRGLYEQLGWRHTTEMAYSMPLDREQL